jgi:hypothetical protein
MVKTRSIEINQNQGADSSERKASQITVNSEPGKKLI